MGMMLPGETTNLTHFYTHFSACSLPVMSLKLLICLLSSFHREKCWKRHPIHAYRCKRKVVGFTEQDDDVCFQSLEILVVLKYT